MEANITIKIGCEAGSNKCGECELLNRYNADRTDMHPTWYCYFGTLGTQYSYKGFNRLPECLDNEKTTSETIPRKEVDKALEELEDLRRLEEYCDTEHGEPNIHHNIGLNEGIERLESLLKEEG